MDVETKALNFAINAHKGQVRKGYIDYPMVLHPMNVANILKEYGFDKNVIAAGYLHDIVEDTKYMKEDIGKIFDQDIISLVMFATEEDRSLSWEERKQITIDKIVNGDMRHKAVVCADKLSNLEDIANIIGQNQNNSLFDRFNAGFEKQKWYYENIYQSLVFNEDINLPIFVRLRNLIDAVFCNKKEENFVEMNNIYKDEYYSDLLKLYYKSKELLKLKSLIKNIKPYVIELAGTPRVGKTKLLNNLIDFFTKGGFKCDFVEEFTKTKRYKDYYFSKWKNKSIPFVNFKIYESILKTINERLLKKPNIILADRALIDRLIWINRLYLNDKIEENQYLNLEEKILLESGNKINITIAMYADADIALFRDYENNLSLEKRSFLNKRRVEEYNNALQNVEKLVKGKNINFWKVDTSNLNKREVSIYVTNILLDDMRKNYLDQAKRELGYI